MNSRANTVPEKGSPFRVLSIDGGGYLGLATAAFIRGIESHFKLRFHDHFDLFCGTSTGAILALGIAAGKSGVELVDLYKDLGPKVFTRTWASRLFGRLYPWPYHSNEALRVALANAFGRATLDDLLREKGKRALITSFCLTTGRPCLFKTDHSERLTQHGRYRLADIALASAAAPVYFPMVELMHPDTRQRNVYCDGGVASNHPALLGYVEAVSECGAAPEDVQVLSLSTPRTDLAERHIEPSGVKRSGYGWITKLPAIFTDSNSMLADQVLKRLSDACAQFAYDRVLLENREGLPFNEATPPVTAILEALGSDRANDNDVRARVQPFLTERRSK